MEERPKKVALCYKTKRLGGFCDGVVIWSDGSISKIRENQLRYENCLCVDGTQETKAADTAAKLLYHEDECSQENLKYKICLLDSPSSMAATDTNGIVSIKVFSLQKEVYQKIPKWQLIIPEGNQNGEVLMDYRSCHIKIVGRERDGILIAREGFDKVSYFFDK